MTIYSRPDNSIFASGAKQEETGTFPDIERGWGVTEKTNFIPPLEYFNAVQNRTDKAIAYLLQRGVAEWSKDIEYPQQAITIKNGQVFFAKQQNTNKDPLSNPEFWVNSFGQKANQSDFERLNNSLIGSVQMFAYDGGQAPEDFLWCDEGLYNPEDYPKLFAKMGYTWGRSGSKFATPPNTEANRFPRCAGGKLTVGMTQSDAIRNIVGTIDMRAYVANDGTSRALGAGGGAFSYKLNDNTWGDGEAIGTSASFKPSQRFLFDTSRVVPTADENRPNDIVYMFAIKYQ